MNRHLCRWCRTFIFAMGENRFWLLHIWNAGKCFVKFRRRQLFKSLCISPKNAILVAFSICSAKSRISNATTTNLNSIFFYMFLTHFNLSYLYFWFDLFHLSVCFMDMLKTHCNDFQFLKHFDEFSGQFKFTIFRSLNSQFQRQILWWVSSLKRAFQKVT